MWDSDGTRKVGPVGRCSLLARPSRALTDSLELGLPTGTRTRTCRGRREDAGLAVACTFLLEVLREGVGGPVTGFRLKPSSGVATLGEGHCLLSGGKWGDHGCWEARTDCGSDGCASSQEQRLGTATEHGWVCQTWKSSFSDSD